MIGTGRSDLRDSTSLAQLVPFGLHEAQIRRVGRQPEDQFVEEEDQPVVAERLGVGADDRQASVQIDVGFILPLGDPLEGREDVLHQIADKAAAFVAGGRGFEGRVETGGIPTLGEFAPARTASRLVWPWFSCCEELLVAQRFPMLLGVLEDLVGQIDARQRRSGMKLPSHDRRSRREWPISMLRAPIMWYGTSRNFLFSTQLVLAADLGQFGDVAHGGIVLEQQVQHRHEVRLTGTEAAVQVARLAARSLRLPT